MLGFGKSSPGAASSKMNVPPLSAEAPPPKGLLRKGLLNELGDMIAGAGSRSSPVKAHAVATSTSREATGRRLAQVLFGNATGGISRAKIGVAVGVPSAIVLGRMLQKWRANRSASGGSAPAGGTPLY